MGLARSSRAFGERWEGTGSLGGIRTPEWTGLVVGANTVNCCCDVIGILLGFNTEDGGGCGRCVVVVVVVVVVVEVVVVVVVAIAGVVLVGSVEAAVPDVRNLIFDLKTSGTNVVVGGGGGGRVGGKGGRVGGGGGGGDASVSRDEELEERTLGPARCRMGLIDGRGGSGRR